jgi:hypothetical protein
MQSIIGLLAQYKTTNAAYPTTTMVLVALSTFGTVAVADPWGKPLKAKPQNERSQFRLRCLTEVGGARQGPGVILRSRSYDKPAATARKGNGNGPVPLLDSLSQ